jgi:hypothetical protein
MIGNNEAKNTFTFTMYCKSAGNKIILNLTHTHNKHGKIRALCVRLQKARRNTQGHMHSIT